MPEENPQLDPEMAGILDRGRKYAELVATPGWSLVLAELQEDANDALAKLRQCASSDPIVIGGFARDWKWYDDIIGELNQKAEIAISARKAVLEDLAEQQKKAEHEIEWETKMREDIYAR